MTRLTLYTRPGCHLCDDLKAVVARVAEKYPVELIEIDVSGNPRLEREYGSDIPVLVRDGVVVARHRLSEAALARLISLTSP